MTRPQAKVPSIPSASAVCRAQEGIPAQREHRDRLLRAIRQYVHNQSFTPPLSFNDLHDHAGRILQHAEAEEAYRNWVTVLLNSETWRPRVAAIPYERRLLLLPQCLRDARQCQGQLDELGLLCKGCGRCAIDSLKREAEGLGYLVLVSEGTAAVLSLVQSGKVQGFVGASCMATLEKVFPIVSMAAVPAIAVPLLFDGCRATAMDLDWLQEAMRLTC
jgi:hypothetical protein